MATICNHSASGRGLTCYATSKPWDFLFLYPSPRNFHFRSYLNPRNDVSKTFIFNLKILIPESFTETPECDSKFKKLVISSIICLRLTCTLSVPLLLACK